jgi:hypothetical protein
MAGARRSYMLGALEGFRKKLEASEPAAAEGAHETSTALLRMADRQLEDFVSTRFPRLSTRWWGGGRRDADSYGDGIADGASITLRRGVEEGPRDRGLQLPE